MRTQRIKLWTSTNGVTHKIIKGKTLCLSATGRSLRKDQAQEIRNCKRCFKRKYISKERRKYF